MKLPIYELLIDESKGDALYALALTNDPAIERDFVKLSQEKIQAKFKTDAPKKQLCGPALIPYQAIYRRDSFGREFEVYCSAETIEKAAISFAKGGYHSSFNQEHNQDNSIDGIVVFESWIVGENDKARDLGYSEEDAPKGTLMFNAQCSDEAWELVENGDFTGFSIEALFSAELKLSLNSTMELVDDLMEKLNSDLDDLSKYDAVVEFTKNNF